ncbi:hypothetical protein DEFDS_P030 (plasmid) [Deferribacter desulfuricans SSM1]|uniref:Prepilin-type N-terminal cleavage/methylation domain-containing protein n=1 Tax=Deferribacter desulfuricans (strain DSM 14783 / JCM 11476 / NBRC 101012 / SSM1) TaxID=639282 RepID=D3PEL6_DEFDS|nr:prepilin-type N-terminal cleavage/methylation domain-containing protein [Deferribacter desulfuricans]BAI81658.1 hypothetical protein DEFDS_P030 [Deferribacter desulfuricans SSM1]
MLYKKNNNRFIRNNICINKNINNKISNNRGYTFIELIIVLTILAILIGTIMGSYHERKMIAICNAVTKELENFAEASLMFYSQKGRGPNNASELYGTYLKKVGNTNVSGKSYIVSSSGDVITITTDVPSGVGTCVQNNTRLSTQVTALSGVDRITLTINGVLGKYYFDNNADWSNYEKTIIYREIYNFTTDTNTNY